MAFGNLGFGEILLLLVIALIIFGPKRLPELAKALGNSVSEFKKSMRGEEPSVKTEVKEVQKDATHD